jgi:UDP-N-acetylglucosamine 1-carboxyvinyltransferase
MALVLAALSTDGESVIFGTELIKRGYDDIVGKLRKIGADIIEK